MGRKADDTEYEITGNDLGQSYKLLSKRWAFGIGAFFTLWAGAAPLLMNVVMADMMNLMTSVQVDDNFVKEIES